MQAKSQSNAWAHACASEAAAADRVHGVAVDGHDLLVVRTRAGLRVFEGHCPHQGALLAEGMRDGDTLTCRNHGWRFDLSSGQRVGGPGCLREVSAREHGGAIEVDASGLATSTSRKVGAPRSVRTLPGPRGWGPLGVLPELRIERMHDTLDRWADRYGPTYFARLGPRGLLVSEDVALFEEILRARPGRYRRPSNIEEILREMGTPGVFSAEGAAWRPQRRLAMQALAQANLRRFYSTLAIVTDRMIARLRRHARRGEPIDILAEMQRLTVDVTTWLVFGHDANTLAVDSDPLQDQLQQIFPAINRRLLSVVPLWRWWPSREDRALDQAVQQARAFVDPLVEKERRALARDPELAACPRNFVQAMIAATDDEGRPFEEEVVRGNLMTMLLAGEDTTAGTLAWAMHELCDAPEIADRIAAESREVSGTQAIPGELDDVGRLRWADAVAQETLRLRPVAPLLFFEANAPCVLGDIAVAPGLSIILLTRRSATRASSFGRPWAFAPQRWLPEDRPSDWAHEPSALFGFGSGPRICPGRSLALLELRCALSAIAREFKVERVGERQDVEEIFAFTMVPRGLRVRLIERGLTP